MSLLKNICRRSLTQWLVSWSSQWFSKSPIGSKPRLPTCHYQKNSDLQ